MRRVIFFAALLLTGSVGLAAVDVPVGQHQHIVKLRYLVPQPNATAPARIQDFVGSLGGRVDQDWRDVLVVTLPDAAVDALRKHGAVKYTQRVVSGPNPQTPIAAPAPVGVPTSSQSRSVAARAAHLVPRPDSAPWTTGTYSYDGAGNITFMGSDAFTYDALSRLSTANVQTKAESYGYDAFGNLISKTTGNDPPLTLSTNVQSNRLVNEGYDTAGNDTGGGLITYGYDPFNMLREKDMSSRNVAELYLYTASDERIGVMPCTFSPSPASGGCWGTQATWSLRDESGKVLRQYQSEYEALGAAWLWVEDYVYRDGLLLGAERVAEEGGRRHFHLDHLGTPRLITNAGGQHLSEHHYYPFGVEINPPGLVQETAAGYDREEPMKFTGHERDFNVGTTSENINYDDYMHARATVPNWGRFLSVDPIGGNPFFPQTWNRYAYALNNPLKYVDPLGLYPCTVIGSDGKPHPGECVDVIGKNPRDYLPGTYPGQLPPDSIPGRFGQLRDQANRGNEFAMMQLGYPARAFGIKPTYDELIAAGVFAGLIRAIGIAGGELGLKAAVSEGVDITFGHGVRHLEGTGLSKLAVESAIKGQIQTALRTASQSGTFWGRVSVEGATIEYRAFTLESGAINVGTYYPVFP